MLDICLGIMRLLLYKWNFPYSRVFLSTWYAETQLSLINGSHIQQSYQVLLLVLIVGLQMFLEISLRNCFLTQSRCSKRRWSVWLVLWTHTGIAAISAGSGMYGPMRFTCIIVKRNLEKPKGYCTHS